MIDNTEAIQESIRLWVQFAGEIIRMIFDFAWDLLKHPASTFFIGAYGGAHLDGGFRGLYGKAAKKVLPKHSTKITNDED